MVDVKDVEAMLGDAGREATVALLRRQWAVDQMRWALSWIASVSDGRELSPEMLAQVNKKAEAALRDEKWVLDALEDELEERGIIPLPF